MLKLGVKALSLTCLRCPTYSFRFACSSSNDEAPSSPSIVGGSNKDVEKPNEAGVWAFKSVDVRLKWQNSLRHWLGMVSDSLGTPSPAVLDLSVLDSMVLDCLQVQCF